MRHRRLCLFSVIVACSTVEPLDTAASSSGKTQVGGSSSSGSAAACEAVGEPLDPSAWTCTAYAGQAPVALSGTFQETVEICPQCDPSSCTLQDAQPCSGTASG